MSYRDHRDYPRHRSRSRDRDTRDRSRDRGDPRDRSRDRNDGRNRSRDRRGVRGGNSKPRPQSLLVRGISDDTSPEELRRVFSRRHGDIRDVYIPKDFNTGLPRGFAFIEYYDQYEASQVKREMDRTFLNGSEIAVLYAQERRKTPDQMAEFLNRESKERKSDRRDDRRSGRSRSRSPGREGRNDSGRSHRHRSRSPRRSRSHSPRGKKSRRSRTKSRSRSGSANKKYDRRSVSRSNSNDGQSPKRRSKSADRSSPEKMNGVKDEQSNHIDAEE